MVDFEKIRAIKKSAQARLRAIPGVHAVGIGLKIVAGKRTKDVSIAVFVSQKKSLAELPAEHVIPSEIEGIKIDIIEQSPPRLLSGPSTPDPIIHRPLIGGIRIQPGGGLGGGGTLGCFAHTNEPQPRIVGLTCQHVVADAKLNSTNINITRNGDTLTVTSTGATGTPGTLVVIEFEIPPSPSSRGAFYTVGNSDSTAAIALGVQNAITKIAIPGVTAVATGSDVEITVPSGSKFEFHFYGPHKVDSKAKLHATIENVDISTHVIHFSGPLLDGNGVYTTVYPGGLKQTFGVFTATNKNMNLNALVSAIAASINAAAADLGMTGISATPSGGTVKIVEAESVVCDISSDIRVGQPDNRFGCSTSWCTNNRIGHVIDARADVDLALIQIDGGLKYLAEIQDIDVVSGFYVVDNNDVSSNPHKEYPVQKRGQSTGWTDGTILFLHMDGFLPLDNNSDFGRHYVDAMQVVSGLTAFAESGDSGSALVSNQAPNEGKVVGIIFAGGSNFLGGPFALATPIKPALEAFKAVPIALEEATTAQKGVARVVPKTSMAMLPEEEASGVSIAGRPSAALRDRLMDVGTEISGTGVGREFAEAVQRHIPETQDLINTHRRVGAVWRRNGGTQIVQSFLEMVQFPERTLPAAITGRPITECLRRIQKALVRYGSARLAADLTRLGPLLIRSTGLTYPQMLAALHGHNLEQ